MYTEIAAKERMKLVNKYAEIRQCCSNSLCNNCINASLSYNEGKSVVAAQRLAHEKTSCHLYRLINAWSVASGY